MDPQNPFIYFQGRLEGCETLDELQTQVCLLARELLDATGATLVLVDGDKSHHVAEDSAFSLWLDCRFPLTQCLSGWAILHATTAVSPDVHNDQRTCREEDLPVPVHSAIMSPLGGEAPFGAIGACWTRAGVPNAQLVATLEKVATLTTVALRRFGVPSSASANVE
ncbi:GAF domain-containing protein [Actinopolymorpha singaporensis]